MRKAVMRAPDDDAGDDGRRPISHHFNLQQIFFSNLSPFHSIVFECVRECAKNIFSSSPFAIEKHWNEVNCFLINFSVDVLWKRTHKHPTLIRFESKKKNKTKTNNSTSDSHLQSTNKWNAQKNAEKMKKKEKKTFSVDVAESKENYFYVCWWCLTPCRRFMIFSNFIIACSPHSHSPPSLFAMKTNMMFK